VLTDEVNAAGGEEVVAGLSVELGGETLGKFTNLHFEFLLCLA
jgi:hypothetical protein